MQKSIFFLIIALFIIGGGYFLNQKFHFFSSGENEKGEILTVSQWSPVLIGDWVIKSEAVKSLSEGDITFNEDSSFYWIMTLNKYKSKTKESNTLWSRAKVEIKGKWGIDTNRFIKLTPIPKNTKVEIGLYKTETEKEPKYDKDGNEIRQSSYKEDWENKLTNYYSEPIFIGEHKNSTHKMTLLSFTPTDILVKAKIYGGDDQIIKLTKQK